MTLFVVILRHRLTFLPRIVDEGPERISEWCSEAALHHESLNVISRLVSVKYLAEVPSEYVVIEVFLRGCYADVVRSLKSLSLDAKKAKPFSNRHIVACISQFGDVYELPGSDDLR